MLIGLLRTIFYLTIFYYLFKLIARFVLPIFLKKGIERMQKQQQNASSAFREEARQKEGTVTVDSKSGRKQHHIVDDNQGEYVDYEEVK